MKINCLELFAGCGGLGYGFHQTEGFHIVCSNELEANIAETYKANFPATHMIVGDITQPDIKAAAYAHFNMTGPTCDVILGGPPCVAYSMAGHRNSRDPRGQLFKEYVAMVAHLKPKVFVMENVKGILTILHDKPVLTPAEQKTAEAYYALETEKLNLLAKKKVWSAQKGTSASAAGTGTSASASAAAASFPAEDRLKEVNDALKKSQKLLPQFRVKVTDIIQETLQALGYTVEMKLLNSANYGVPQKRERVIFLGVRNDVKQKIQYPAETHNKNGTEGKQKWVSVRTAIDDLKDMPEQGEHLYTHHSPEFIEKIKKTPIGKSVNPKYTEAFFRCEPDQPSNTVKENHGGVFIHYEKNRVMTPRELARLQSFPDTFKFKGSKTNMLVQIGNAVPCGLAQAIAKEVKKMFPA